MGGRGSGGKNKKPSAIRKLQGNAGHRPLNDREPEPPKGDPAMPKDLTARERVEWERLLPLLRDMKVLTTADSDALAALCTARVRWRQAEAGIERSGQVVIETLERGTGKNRVVTKRIKKNPLVTVASDALRHYRGLLADFGLTPASRAGVQTSHGEPQDPLDSFFSGADPDEAVQ